MRRFLMADASGKRLPDEVFTELVDLLFTNLSPIVIMTLAIAVVGGLAALRTDDPLLAGLAAVGALTSMARLATGLAYRGRPVSRAETRADAQAWERRYAVSGLGFAVALGLFNARALLVGDLLVDMLVTGLIFGYGAGLVTRAAVRPLLCSASLLLAVTPTAAAMAWNAQSGGVDHGLAYAAQTLLILTFAAGGLQTMAGLYRTTVGHLLTRRNFADLARQDALTGLPNRLLLRERFDEDIARLAPGGRLLAVHFLDLDRFKPINDLYGHPVGDALLKAVAERLKRMLRAGDTVARLGGDEFVVVQTGIAHVDEARMLALRIVKTLSAPYGIDGLTLTIGTSIGIAVAPEDGVDLERLSARADTALYLAKSNGRGSIAFWRETLQQPAPAIAASAA